MFLDVHHGRVLTDWIDRASPERPRRARPGPVDRQKLEIAQGTARQKSRLAHRCERGMVQALNEGDRSVALRYRRLLAAVTAVPLALASACGGSGTPGSGNAAGLASAPSSPVIVSAPAPGPQTLSETGSTLLFPLMGAWAAAYHRQYPNVSVTTAGTGSGKGISAASAGTVSIGASAAYLSSGNLAQ